MSISVAFKPGPESRTSTNRSEDSGFLEPFSSMAFGLVHGEADSASAKLREQ